jgi:hypothetical protein
MTAALLTSLAGLTGLLLLLLTGLRVTALLLLTRFRLVLLRVLVGVARIARILVSHLVSFHGIPPHA